MKQKCSDIMSHHNVKLVGRSLGLVMNERV